MAFVILAGVALLAMGTKTVNSAQDAAVAASPTFNKFDPLFLKASSQYGVPFVWQKAICMNESSLGQAKSVALGLTQPSNVSDTVSDDGLSWGLMQVTLTAAHDFDEEATSVELNDAAYSVDIAGQLLKRTMGQFSSNDPRFEEYVIKSYNAGAGRIQQMIQNEAGNLDLTDAQAAAIANAETYWERYQRNKQVVLQNQPNMANS